MAREVFISYRSEDKSAAERVCELLEREDIRCWIAPRNIAVGQEWATAIVTALQGCSHFVLILSSNSKNAKQISREAELADKAGLPIITFRVEDVEPPPGLIYFLGNVQWLDAFGDRFDTAVARLLGVVRTQGEASCEPAHEDKVSGGGTLPPVGPAESAATITQSLSRGFESHATPVGRRGLPPWVWVLAAVLAAAGVASWYFLRSPPPDPANQPAAASAFGIEYMRTRDSGALDRAYAMLGPAFQASLDRQKFGSAAGALQVNARATNYAPAGPCTLRERGAYTCDYTVSYSNGRTRNERLVMADRNGAWVIAGDRSGPF
jgi:hypothetical protein